MKVLLVKAHAGGNNLVEELIKINDFLDEAGESSEVCMVLEASPRAVKKAFLDRAHQGRGATRSLIEGIRRKTKDFYAISCIFGGPTH